MDYDVGEPRTFRSPPEKPYTLLIKTGPNSSYESARARIPRNKVSFYQDGRVAEVTLFGCSDARNPIHVRVFRHWGDKYFASSCGGGYGEDSAHEVAFLRLPKTVKKIFQSRDRIGVQRMQEEGLLEGFAKVA